MIEAHGASLTAPDRATNEDTFLVDVDSSLFIVADGLGGKAAGEVASSLTVEVVAGFIEGSEENYEISWPFGIDARRSLNANRLLTAVQLANRRVWKQADENDEFLGMGSTIVAALIADGEATICSAGDSRVYLARDGVLRQLTVDDSFVQAVSSEGLMSGAQLADHPMRNLITKAIGAAKTIDPQVVEEPLADGDVLILCSDGLYKFLDEERILDCIQAGDGVRDTVERLLEAAAEKADDDVTAVALQRLPD